MAFKIKRFISPINKTDEPKPKAAKDVKSFDEQFEIVKAKFPKSMVTRVKNKLGSYTVRKGSGQFTYTPGKPAD